MFKEIAGKEAVVDVGWFENQMYDETTESFYSLRPKPNSITMKNPRGTPRKFYKSEAKPIAQVAIQNEFGVPEKNVPPRPFMKRALDGYKRKWARKVRDELPQMEPMDLSKMAKRLSTTVINDIQTCIDELMFPPNAPSTIKRKGFNNPLIDTGTMRDTVTWREVK